MNWFWYGVIVMLVLESILNRILSDRRDKMHRQVLSNIVEAMHFLTEDYASRHYSEVWPKGVCPSCWNKYKKPQRYNGSACTNDQGPCVYDALKDVEIMKVTRNNN